MGEDRKEDNIFNFYLYEEAKSLEGLKMGRQCRITEVTQNKLYEHVEVSTIV